MLTIFGIRKCGSPLPLTAGIYSHDSSIIIGTATMNGRYATAARSIDGGALIFPELNPGPGEQVHRNTKFALSVSANRSSQSERRPVGATGIEPVTPTV
jgi:hypothetical protein